MKVPRARLVAAPVLAGVRSVVNRLRGRTDREHEMSFNRLAFATIITLSLYFGGNAESRYALNLMGVYIALALSILIHIVIYPKTSHPRRFCALLLDSVFLSCQLHLGGESGAAFFPIFLWVSFGNGFRFGLTWLRIAMVVTFLGFAAVVAATPFWFQQMHLSIGLLASLVVLPAYAGTLISRLSKARQLAEQANEAKTLFLAGVSHELRTPLTAIIGMGGMLRTTRLDPSQAEMSETIQNAAVSLLSLITGILDFAQIEAGRMPAEAEVFDLPALLRETRGLVAAQAQVKGLTVALHIDAHLPVLVACNRRNLSDILVNLAANAVKFTERGSVVITAETRPAANGTSRLIIRVIDSGIGIAADAQARIFESFTQADVSIRNRFGGTGLGLALARRRAELLGGSLRVHSVEGQGAEFILDVEMTVPPQLAETDEAGAAEASLTVILCGPRNPRRAAIAGRMTDMGIAVTDARSLLAGKPGAAAFDRSVVVIIDDPAAACFTPPDDALDLHARAAELPWVMCPAGTRAGLDHLAWPFSAWLLADEADPELRAALENVYAQSRSGSVRAAGPETVVPHSPRNVLVADDNLVNRRVLSKILETAGHTVTAVVDGEVALDLLEHSPRRFDIVLMDVNMPVMDGLEATKLYRFIALGQPHLPIIGLTADATPEAAQRCLDAGMDLCVTKPVRPADLLDLIARLTGDESEAGGKPVPPASGEPRIASGGAAVLNAGMLKMLEQLGGQEFLGKLIDDFLVEAHDTARAVMDAAAQADHMQFRSAVHALHSSAANLGAQSLTELCTAWQGLRSTEFSEQTRHFPGALQAELDRTREALLEARAALV
ncbi:MAG: response regulator [Janthinobacterium lividum]